MFELFLCESNFICRTQRGDWIIESSLLRRTSRSSDQKGLNFPFYASLNLNAEIERERGFIKNRSLLGILEEQ